MKRASPLAWFWLLLAGLYLLVPLLATLQFSLQAQMRSGIPISFKAYIDVLTNPNEDATYDFIGL